MTVSDHANDTDKAMLGSILMEPERVFKLMDEQNATPELFNDVHVRKAVKAAQNLNAAGHAVDVLTVADALQNTPGPAEGWTMYLNACLDLCPALAYTPKYLAMLQDRQRQRRLADLGTELTQAAKTENTAAIDAVHAELQAIQAPVDIGDVNLQARFFQIQQAKGLTAGERHHQMASAVLEKLHARGRFFFHAEHRDFATTMFFDGERKLLLPIAGDPFLSWLAVFIGINRTERAFQFILAAIQDEALTGKTTGLVPESFWAARPGALYLSNGDGHLVKITPEAVTQEDNGTDEILFPAGDTLAPWKLVEPRNPFDTCTLFKSVSTTAPHGKILFELWVCALASNQRTKPPLVLSGPVGSGKTRLAVGIAELYGLPPRITTITKNGEEDFWTQMHAGGMVCFDNADTRTDWLPDALAAASTDGCREKRRLYTDTSRIVQRARSWAIITSANPTFAADAGLADRLLVIRLERRADETAEAALSDEIAVHRNVGLSWIAEVLSVALADTKIVPSGLNKRHPDFSTLAVRLGRAMGKEQAAIEAIQSAESDKSMFNLENDAIGAALIEIMRANDIFSGTAAELLEQLKSIDPSFEGRLSSQRLAKRLGRLWPHLAAIFDAKQEKGHGGIKSFCFRQPRNENGGIGGIGEAFSEKSYER